MKKLCLLILFLASTIIKGQNFGIVAGVNYSSYFSKVGGEQLEWDYKPGAALGASFRYQIKDALELDFGMQFSQKGGVYKDENFTRTEQVLYLDLPVLIRPSFPISTNKKNRLYGEFGSIFSLLMMEHLRSESQSGEASTRTNSFKIGNSSKPVDLGVQLGAGVSLGALNLGLSYQLGLLNLVSLRSTTDSVYKNRNIAFRVSWVFVKK